MQLGGPSAPLCLVRNLPICTSAADSDLGHLMRASPFGGRCTGGSSQSMARSPHAISGPSTNAAYDTIKPGHPCILLNQFVTIKCCKGRCISLLASVEHKGCNADQPGCSVVPVITINPLSPLQLSWTDSGKTCNAPVVQCIC